LNTESCSNCSILNAELLELNVCLGDSKVFALSSKKMIFLFKSYFFLDRGQTWIKFETFKSGVVVLYVVLLFTIQPGQHLKFQISRFLEGFKFEKLGNEQTL
jgi:hypothetical protein